MQNSDNLFTLMQIRHLAPFANLPPSPLRRVRFTDDPAGKVNISQPGGRLLSMTEECQRAPPDETSVKSTVADVSNDTTRSVYGLGL